MVQWLRICLLWEDPTCHGATKPMLHNNRALTRETMLHNQKPPQWEARASQLNSSPHVLQLEKALHAAMKTHPQPKIKTKTNRKPQDFPCLLVHNYIILSSIRLFATLWTVARQASLSIGFSRQEYWSRLPCPPFRGSSWPRNQTHVSCISCTAGEFFTAKSSGKPITISVFLKNTQTKTKKVSDFPDSPAAKTLHNKCRGPEFNPWSEN